MNAFLRGNHGGSTMPAGRNGTSSSNHSSKLQATLVLATSAAVASAVWPCASAVQRRCPVACSAATSPAAQCQPCHPGPGMCLNNSCCGVESLRCRPGSVVYGMVELEPRERALLMAPWCQLKQTMRINQ